MPARMTTTLATTPAPDFLRPPSTMNDILLDRWGCWTPSSPDCDFAAATPARWPSPRRLNTRRPPLPAPACDSVPAIGHEADHPPPTRVRVKGQPAPWESKRCPSGERQAWNREAGAEPAVDDCAEMGRHRVGVEDCRVDGPRLVGFAAHQVVKAAGERDSEDGVHGVRTAAGRMPPAECHRHHREREGSRPMPTGERSASPPPVRARTTFAQLMIDHHQGAVTMAKNEQKNGSNADAKKLADAAVTAQTAEIEKMNKILDRL
ncbi:DUF305 domain-containing protein [Streptomyces sp. NPDC057909]|uniref:DUF305 domain-containing protein n=1 Tax=Streptomyces sp. NPDC057909 TaxID=3346277 RepID=UPI0036E1E5C1